MCCVLCFGVVVVVVFWYGYVVVVFDVDYGVCGEVDVYDEFFDGVCLWGVLFVVFEEG